MTGHSHIAYSEQVNYSDENGTACRMIHNSSVSQPRVYNAAGTEIVYGNGGSEGYVVNVYDDYILYNGTNLKTKKKVPVACYMFPSYVEKRSDATAISITKMPDKTLYDTGDYFDAAGIEVTAAYADGSKRVVQGWGLEKNMSITADTKKVTIVYGNLKADVPIRIRGSIEALEGAGTYENPYRISSADDFMIFTKAFEKIIGTSSNDNNTFGKGLYFLQTEDIDLTGNTGYKGTSASGGNKYGFSGVYNGGGHTIKVNLTTSGSDLSVFPYLNGVLMNVNFEGSISAASYAQPIRTVGSYGRVINCSSKMSLNASTVNGLSQSNYGKAIRYFSGNTLNGSTKNVYSNTNSGCTYTDCYYDAVITDGNGTRADDYTIAALNNPSAASVAAAVQELTAYSDIFGTDDIALWDNMSVAKTLNSESGTLKLIEEVAAKPIDNEEYIITKTISNYSDTPVELVAIAALYGENNTLINCVFADKAKALAMSTNDISFSFDVIRNAEEVKDVKVFIWSKDMSQYF